MQTTTNYKLKMPEGTDPVDIQDFNDNTQAIDKAIAEKASSSGGSISDMTVKTLDESTSESYPIPGAGETTKTFLGKVRKYLSNLSNWMTGVCLLGSIVNNCVTNNPNLPLSAAQGKALMDLYNVLNTKRNIEDISKKFTAEKENVAIIAKKYDRIVKLDVVVDGTEIGTEEWETIVTLDDLSYKPGQGNSFPGSSTTSSSSDVSKHIKCTYNIVNNRIDIRIIESINGGIHMQFMWMI